MSKPSVSVSRFTFYVSAISWRLSSFLHRCNPYRQQVCILGEVAVDVLSHGFVVGVYGEITVINHFQTNGRLVVAEEPDIPTRTNASLGRANIHTLYFQEIALGRLPDSLAGVFKALNGSIP